jgi:WD40 repeat protein
VQSPPYFPSCECDCLDGKTLASGSQDKTIRFWDTITGKEIRTIQAHGIYVLDLSFSSDSKTLASASNDGTAKLWDVSTGKEITIFRHHNTVNSVSISPDGNTLATGSIVNSVKLWDIITGKEITTFKGHITFKLESNSSVDNVRFSPDGKAFAYANRNGTITVWNLNFDDLLTKGCNWVRDYLHNNPNVSESDRHLCDGIGTTP